MSQTSMESFADEIFKLAACEMAARRRTGAGKTRTGKMPINVDTMLAKEKTATLATDLGMMGAGFQNVGRGAVNLLGSGVKHIAQHPGKALALAGAGVLGWHAHRLKSKAQLARGQWQLGRQYAPQVNF